jgi:hypothetical protein
MNEELGGELTDIPNKKYQKFFETFKEVETLSSEQWKPVHLIGYFAKKYRQQYNVEYKFKLNSPLPSKCFEIFQIKKLSYMMTSKPKLLKEYIDWVFTNKIVKAKKRITSISFLTHEETVNEYKINVLLAGNHNSNIDRFTPLPQNYIEIFLAENITAATYGDLAFVYQMSGMDLLFDKIKLLGFDLEILKKIV